MHDRSTDMVSDVAKQKTFWRNLMSASEFNQESTSLAEIDIYGGISVLAAAVDQVFEVLTIPRIEFIRGGSQGYRRRINHESWFQVQDDGLVRIPTGLVPRVCDVLSANGYEITIRDHRQFDGVRYREAMSQALIDEVSLIDAVRSHPLGQIEVRDFAEMIRDIVRIASTYPGARIVIATGTMRQASRIAWRLGWYLHQYVPVVSTKHPMSSGRIHVSTYRHAAEVSPWDLEFLLLADPQELTGKSAIEGIARLALVPRRIYAFVQRLRFLEPAVAIAVKALAGEVIYGTGPQPIEVDVRLCSSASFPTPLPGCGLDRKRAIWHSDARNRLIAGIARTAAARDIRAIWEYGLYHDQTESAWAATPGVRTVAVLVESTEHARVLSDHLPGWEIGTLANSDDEPRLADNTITTWSYAAQFGIHASIVVRADGGSSPLPVVIFRHGGSRRTLIDINDELDVTGRRDMFSRLADYRGRGWNLTGVPGTPETPVRRADRSPDAFAARPKNLVCMMGEFYASGQRFTLRTLIEDAAYSGPQISVYPPRNVKPANQAGM